MAQLRGFERSVDDLAEVIGFVLVCGAAPWLEEFGKLGKQCFKVRPATAIDPCLLRRQDGGFNVHRGV